MLITEGGGEKNTRRQNVYWFYCKNFLSIILTLAYNIYVAFFSFYDDLKELLNNFLKQLFLLANAESGVTLIEKCCNERPKLIIEL